jgi:hypothetical protein
MSRVKYEDNDCWTSLFKNRSIKHDGEYHSIFKIAYSLKNNIDLYDKEKAYVHICDNNMCINPGHLTITHEQNRNNYIFVSNEERFWSFVDKKGVNECWEWKGSKRKETNRGASLTRTANGIYRDACWWNCPRPQQHTRADRNIG